jgi:serine protease Do
MEDLISDGKVTRGWLGVSIQDLDEGMAKALKLEDRNGAIISQVIKDSPAEEAGMKEQDVIIQVDGEKVNDSSNLKNLISSGRPNDKTKLIVIRDGDEKNLIVTLGTRPNEKDLTATYSSGVKSFDLLGLRVETYETEDGVLSMVKEGVKVLEIKPGSPADYENIHQGDIIVEIGKNTIADENNYNSALEDYSLGDTIMFRILRGNSPLYIAFEIN